MRRILGILVVASVFAGTALRTTGAPAANPKPTPRPAAAAPASVLRLAMPDSLPQVDPALVESEDSLELANLLYTGLVKLDSHYRVVPAAAARIQISPDHRTYTFYLRHNMHFSNGDALVAQDFRFSITRSLLPSMRSAGAPVYLLDIQGANAVLAGKTKNVSGIRVIDNYTLQLVARWPVPYFLMELTYPTSFALDEKAISKLGPIDNSAWYLNPVSSGPYRLKSWSPNSQIVLVANKRYYGGKLATHEITISLLPLPATSVYQYVSHTLDVVALPSDDPSVLHQPGVHQTTSLAIDGLYMDFKSKPFDDIRVRRALTLALNRTSLVMKSMGASVTPFSGFVPPNEPGYDSGLRVPSYDPVGARGNLTVAGYSGGKKFPTLILYCADDAATTALAEAIVKSWHRMLKISAQVQPLTLNTLVAKIQSSSVSLYLSGWSADYPDPHDWLSSQWKSKVLDNNVHYQNPVFDQLVSTADVTWHQSRRLKLYSQAQQILVDDVAWVPLYIPHRVVYIRPGVHNLVLTGYGLIPRAGTWSQVQYTPPPVQRGAL